MLYPFQVFPPYFLERQHKHKEGGEQEEEEEEQQHHRSSFPSTELSVRQQPEPPPAILCTNPQYAVSKGSTLSFLPPPHLLISSIIMTCIIQGPPRKFVSHFLVNFYINARDFNFNPPHVTEEER